MGSDRGGHASDSARQWATLEEVTCPDSVSSNEMRSNLSFYSTDKQFPFNSPMQTTEHARHTGPADVFMSKRQ